jgi:pSer/pThr/pTyr-binding forkhead associated (FHA) protein
MTPGHRAFASKGRAEDLQQEVHCLEADEGSLAERLIVINSSGARIGRTAPADLVISHKSVSREHCIVGLANDELLVTDLNSTNGTFVDDVRIHHATILPVGSILKVGEVILKHAVRSSAEAYTRGESALQAGRLAAAS